MPLSSILIVDDSGPVRLLLKSYFADLGLTDQVEAKNGFEAISFLQSRHFDVVSLDIIMPEMDGIECLKEIQAQKFQTSVFICSYLSMEPKIQGILENILPSEQILVKDFNDQVQKQRLRNLLNELSLSPSLTPASKLA